MFSSVVDFGSRHPIPYESGPMAHHSMRAELYEIQKADLGRKYARVDRRPLDPPPVVQLRFYDTQSEGVEQEISSYEEVKNVGLICSVDLFPVPPPPGFEEEQRKRNSWEGGSSSRSGSSTPVSQYNGSDGRLGSDSLPPPSVSSSRALSVAGDLDSTDVVHYVNAHPVRENSKVTPSLVGNTVVQPNVVEYQGKKALVFVFPDLAVKAEGHFILRYRVFDLYSRTKGPTDGAEHVAMQAECYGGPFRVYSTKEFPGLNASTELTKHLARWGVRLNIRETERRRRSSKKQDGEAGPPETPLYTTAALPKSKKRKSDGADEDDDWHEGYD